MYTINMKKNKLKKKLFLIFILVLILIAVVSFSYAYVSKNMHISTGNINQIISFEGEYNLTTYGNTETNVNMVDIDMFGINHDKVLFESHSNITIELHNEYERAGTTCSYNYVWIWDEESDNYIKSKDTEKEYTISGPFDEIQVPNYNNNNNILGTGKIATTSSTLKIIDFTTKFYNLKSVNQKDHEGKTYKGSIRIAGIRCKKFQADNIIYILEHSCATVSGDNNEIFTFGNSCVDPTNYALVDNTDLCEENALYRIISTNILTGETELVRASDVEGQTWSYWVNNNFSGKTKVTLNDNHFIASGTGSTEEPFYISKNNILLNSLILSNDNTFQNKYNLNDALNTTGLTVTAVYSDGTTRVLTQNSNPTLGYTVSNQIKASDGYKYNITYTENEITKTVPLYVQIGLSIPYTNTYTEYITPVSGYYYIEAKGAQGGNGAKGANTSGYLYLTEGEVLYFYTGGQGTGIRSGGSETLGGYNGGGNGDYVNSIVVYGGGGATDVRCFIDSNGKCTSNTSNLLWNDYLGLNSRIMVAGGGGGSGSGGYGGFNGGTILDGTFGSYLGRGGTQVSGGAKPATYSGSSGTQSAGSFGQGGQGGRANTNGGGGGGGGGYYGGSGASGPSSTVWPGGGGSSYISGYLGSIAITSSGSRTVRKIEETTTTCTTSNALDNISCSYHYSNKIFNYTKITNNYNSGNGSIAITLIKDIIQKAEGNVSLTYSTTNSIVEYTVNKTGYYYIETLGAQGGGGGAYGARANGYVYLEKNEILYLFLGSQGTQTALSTGLTEGGFNGGGGGGYVGELYAAGGGGATDVRCFINSSGKCETNRNHLLWNDYLGLNSRIIVAGGGGGSGGGGYGGFNGGTQSDGTYGSYFGRGGTQVSGGAKPATYSGSSGTQSAGSFGQGGQGGRANTNGGGGGGGGGYYGGSGGSGPSSSIWPGGGGSSYVSGYYGSIAITSESNRNPRKIEGTSTACTTSNAASNHSCSYHYSNKVFLIPDIIDNTNSGNGKINLTYTNDYMENKVSENINIAFDASKKVYEYTINSDGYYLIESWGAQGGNGAKGAYTSGYLYLTTGEILYLYIGGQGTSTRTTGSFTLGGYNGGGYGDYVNSVVSYGGGGATDVRCFIDSNGKCVRNTNSLVWYDEFGLNNRIMVAGGGGGSGGGGYGGFNGGTQSDGTYGSYFGRGGTQVSGGAKPSTYGDSSGTQTAGSFGQGGGGGRAGNNGGGGGGGGGYYGGSGGSGPSSGVWPGGGGSSYVSGHLGTIAITSATNRNPRSIINTSTACTTSNASNDVSCSYHYSNKILLNTEIKANNNSGNGKIKITYKSDYIENKASGNVTLVYDSTKNFIEYTATNNGYYHFESWGAQGGNGAKGAYTSGYLYLTAGEILYLYIGSNGNTSSSIGVLGGYNGGGNSDYVGSSIPGGGGGATDVRCFVDSNGKCTSNTSNLIWYDNLALNNRIMVAGGGGGSGGGGYGGFNGGTQSDGTYGSYFGKGGTQVSGGAKPATYSGSSGTQSAGSFGQGGQGGRANTNGGGGGGGGGYYGGSGGSGPSSSIWPGGGGSSFVSGHLGAIAISSSSNRNPRNIEGTSNVCSTTNAVTDVSCSYHYTNKIFANTKIVDNTNTGNGRLKVTFTSDYIESKAVGNVTLAYDSTKNFIEYTANSTGYYLLEAWGGQGGNGAKGAYTKGYLYLTTGEVIYLYIGSIGTGTRSYSSFTLGGYNGGGYGDYINSIIGYGGGGATDVRCFIDSNGKCVRNLNNLIWNDPLGLNSRIMVAGGGGGNGSGGYGGFNGGTQSDGTYGSYFGRGGTQVSGGAKPSTYGGASGTQSAGSFGQGGQGGRANTNGGGGGGGGGYYGGSGASGPSYGAWPGGGGSSFISGYAGAIAITSSTNRNPRSIINTSTACTTSNASSNVSCSYHYSDKKFVLPTITNNSNTGNGKINITFIGSSIS